MKGFCIGDGADERIMKKKNTSRRQNYCVVENNYKENHAGSKARNDVSDLLVKRAHWTPISVHHSQNGNTLDKLRFVFLTLFDWTKVLIRTPGNARLMIQYPLANYPRVSFLAKPFIHLLHRIKHVQILMLIHDLDSLRHPECQESMQKNEHLFLDEADGIICHNPAMHQYLLEMHLSCPIEELGIFDYLMKKSPNVPAADGTTVISAGNLTKEKAGYLYQVSGSGISIPFHLYGPGFHPEHAASNLTFCGEYTPEALPFALTGDFGLVWDGDSLETCSGQFGTYLRYNNPHKTSLYLACGLPVIVWRESAMADFIVRHQAGFAVSSLFEMQEKLHSQTKEEYASMKKHAEALSFRLQKGIYFQTALKKLLSRLPE